MYDRPPARHASAVEERAFAYWQQDIPEAYWHLDGAALIERVAEARRQARHAAASSSATTTSARTSSSSPTSAATPSSWRSGPPSTPRPSTSSSAASTSWPKPPTSSARRTRRSSCRTWPPAARWPTWPTRTTSTPPGTSSQEAGIADSHARTYMNSAASLKAFCGEHGGIVCTSSNAREGARVGVRARREGALLPRPAPRPQHRRQDGHPARRDARSGTTSSPTARSAA